MFCCEFLWLFGVYWLAGSFYRSGCFRCRMSFGWRCCREVWVGVVVGVVCRVVWEGGCCLNHVLGLMLSARGA